MSDSARSLMEITFNFAYLIVVWALVIAMWRRLPSLPIATRRLGRLFTTAFALLALGDTGHVGFRAVAFLRGDINTTFNLLGLNLGLVGLGALSTAITVTFFYVMVLAIWRQRFGKPYGWFGALLFACAVARLLLMIPPVNQWNSVVPPQPWSLVRNLPLIVQGLGVAYLILGDARAVRDRSFMWMGVCILISYAFYLPVILFVQRFPAVGMLMIPKTLAYVAIAIIAYRRLFVAQMPEAQRQGLAGSSPSAAV